MDNLNETVSAPSLNVSAVPPATGSSIINIGKAERITSVIGGGILATLGLRNIRERNGIVMALAGGFLVMRGLTGFCAVSKLLNRNTARKKAAAIEVTGALMINKPREEVYAYWRNLGNLPNFMEHLEEVVVHDENRSAWKARIPGGIATISWEAEITADEPGSYLSWCSLPGSVVDNAGEVRFIDAPEGRGTHVYAEITYRLPAGDVGAVVGKMFNPVVEQLVREDIRRFKNILEGDEATSAEVQPSGRKGSRTRSRENSENAGLDYGIPERNR